MDIAIVGFGPRGLHSLECLIAQSIKKKIVGNLQIIICDSNAKLGVGIAWELDQPDSNWINISDHALESLKERKPIHTSSFNIPGFKSYSLWLKNFKSSYRKKNQYQYPPRNQMGRYLNQRAESIVLPLIEMGIVRLLSHKVLNIKWKSPKFNLLIQNHSGVVCDRCLVTIGHTPTKWRKENIENANHANKNNLIYIHNPYTDDILSHNYKNKKVAIIGLGLSMIDIIRMLTVGKQGQFISNENNYFLTYKASDETPISFIPYSLDGLPCMPKPLGKNEDKKFEPSKEQLIHFKDDLKSKLQHFESKFTLSMLIKLFSDFAGAIYFKIYQDIDQNHLSNLIYNWIIEEKNNHSLFLDTSLSLKEYIEQSIKMAMGEIRPSLDYSIGQIWRHFQPTMYRIFAFASIRPEVINEIIDVDERIKRYSYGPPVKSMLQMLALIDSSVISTKFINDPTISRVPKGWRIEQSQKTVCAEVLINSVMDNPNLSQLDSPLINSLKEQKLVTEVAEGLGIRTNKFSMVVNDFENIPLYVIGRNAKGSILGADAILECFSPEITTWAKHVADCL